MKKRLTEPRFLYKKNYCFKTDAGSPSGEEGAGADGGKGTGAEGGGGSGAPALTEAQQKEIQLSKQKIVESASKNPLPGAKKTEGSEGAPATTVSPEFDYKAEYELLVGDPVIKTLASLKKIGKNPSDLFTGKKPDNSGGVDYSKLSRKELYSLSLEQKGEFTKEEKEALVKKFDTLDPEQQEERVSSFREKIKSSPSEDGSELFRSVQEEVEKTLPIRQKEQTAFNSYVKTLQEGVSSVKDSENKAYSKEIQGKIFDVAKRVAVITRKGDGTLVGISADDIKGNIDMARRIVCSDEIDRENFLAGVALGAEEALKSRFQPNADGSRSSTATHASGADKDKHILPKGTVDPDEIPFGPKKP